MFPLEMSTTTVIELQGNEIISLQEQHVHTNGRVVIRRLLTPSNEWLRHVLPALNGDDLLDSMGLSNLPERLLDQLVDTFAHQIPAGAPNVVPTLKPDRYRALPRRRVKKNHTLGPFQEEACPICLAEWKCRESVTTLPCGHEFHHRCVRKWLTKQQPKCPVCRMLVK